MIAAYSEPLQYFVPKNLSLISQKYGLGIRESRSGQNLIRIRIQGSEKHQIPGLDPQHCLKYCFFFRTSLVKTNFLIGWKQALSKCSRGSKDRCVTGWTVEWRTLVPISIVNSDPVDPYGNSLTAWICISISEFWHRIRILNIYSKIQRNLIKKFNMLQYLIIYFGT